MAQLAKADRLVGHCRWVADLLTQGIADVPGVLPPAIASQAQSSYWYYVFSVDPAVLGVGAAEVSRALCAEGVSAVAGGGGPLHLREMFQRRRAFGDSHFPWDHGDRRLDDVSYVPGTCPVAERYADATRTTAVQLPCNEGITAEDVQDIVQAIRKVTGYYMALR